MATARALSMTAATGSQDTATGSQDAVSRRIYPARPTRLILG
jgi:hypothetical protein